MAHGTCVAKGPVASVDYVQADTAYVVHFGPISIRLDAAALDSLLATLIQAHEARTQADESVALTTTALGSC